MPRVAAPITLRELSAEEGRADRALLKTLELEHARLIVGSASGSEATRARGPRDLANRVIHAAASLPKPCDQDGHVLEVVTPRQGRDGSSEVSGVRRSPRSGRLRAPRAARRPKLEIRTLNGQSLNESELPVPIRLAWVRESERYARLRNTAWFVRNSRLQGFDDGKPMAHFVLAVRQLLLDGEPLEAVVPSMVDLFMKP